MLTVHLDCLGHPAEDRAFVVRDRRRKRAAVLATITVRPVNGATVEQGERPLLVFREISAHFVSRRIASL
jgi:hypothetical protein